MRWSRPRYHVTNKELLEVIIVIQTIRIHITTHIIIHTTDIPGTLHSILDSIAVDIMDTVHRFLTILLIAGIIAVAIIPDMDTEGIISVVIILLEDIDTQIN